MIVKMPFVAGNNLDALKWAMKNCPSFEKLSILTPDGEENPMFITRYCTMCYHFGSEQDAVLFTLRWR